MSYFNIGSENFNLYANSQFGHSLIQGLGHNDQNGYEYVNMHFTHADQVTAGCGMIRDNNKIFTGFVASIMKDASTVMVHNGWNREDGGFPFAAKSVGIGRWYEYSKGLIIRRY